MKINEEVLVFETQNVQQENTFGIGDMGMIFDILRNKMYSDRIYAICREISCNARDANREVGKGDLPIKIVLPNHFDAHFRVIDNGPGISPERMMNVFIQYSNSTKRDSNTQTGGFGLGGKTPFSYTDSFTITTVIDGIKYQYGAIIDSTKVGKLVLFSKVPTDDSNGTEICVPVQHKDFAEFAEKTERAIRWWDVQPIVNGNINSKKYKDSDCFIKYDNWEVYTYSDVNYYRDMRITITILIDGIEYNVEDNVLNEFKNKDTINIFAGYKKIVIRYGNGIIPLNANRETIAWDQTTKNKVFDTLVSMKNYCEIETTSRIQKADSYLEALKLYNKTCKLFENSHNKSKKYYWNDLRIIDSIHNYNEMCLVFNKEQGKVSKDIKTNTFQFAENKIVIINDLEFKTLNVKSANDIFELLPEINCIQVVSKKSWEDISYYKNYQEHIPNMLLSKFLKDRKSALEYKQKKIVYKFEYNKFCRTSISCLRNDNKNKVFVLLKKARETKDGYVLASDRYNVSYNAISIAMCQLLKAGVSIYAFDATLYEANKSSYKHLTESMLDIMSYVKDKVLINYDFEKLYSCFAIAKKSNTIHLTFKNTTDQLIAKLKEESYSINDLFSNYSKLVDESELDVTVYNLYQEIIHHFNPKLTDINVDKAYDDIVKAYNLIDATYPMLTMYCKFGAHLYEKEFKNITDYVKLIDANNLTSSISESKVA